jgi:hypothetical protein
MNPISLMRLHRLLLPSPRSHWSATGPRSKTQPTATRHTQWKHTRHSCWHLKPVRPLLWDLASHQAGETGQTILANWSGRFCPELPKNPSERKNASRTSPPLKKNSHSTTETFSLKNSSQQPTRLNRSDRFGKPI